MKAHKSSVISQKAQIAGNVTIGPFCVIGDNVKIGSGTQIASHVVIDGHVDIGQDNSIGIGSIIGLEPQSVNYDGQPSFVKIGDSNILKEYVTIHRGSHDSRTTSIGNKNYLMAYTHLGHDVILHDEIIIANATQIGGHVIIEDKANIGGLVGIHQFKKIGTLCMVSAMSRVNGDVLPYSMVAGDPCSMHGVNTIGLSRAGFSKEEISAIRKVIRELFFSDKLRKDVLSELNNRNDLHQHLSNIMTFISSSKSVIACRGKRGNHAR